MGTRPREAAKLGYGRGWELYEIRQTGVQSTLDENGRPSVRLAHRRELGPGASMGDIATRVKRARTAAGLTQAQLAIATGVKRTAVVQWESLNGTNPTPEHMATIAIKTGVLFEWLATGRGPATAEGELLAAAFHGIAQTALESKMLDAMKRLPPAKQELALKMVCVLAES